MQADKTIDLEMRMPPQSTDTESALLGCILAWGNSLERVQGFLRAEHFYVAYNGYIYQACVDLHWQDRPVDLVGVAALLSDRHQLELCGGQLGLMNIVDSVVTDANIEDYAHLVIDKWKRRKLISLSQEIIRDAHLSHKSWEEIIKDAEDSVFSMTDSFEQKGLVHISEIAVQEYERIERVCESGEKPGIDTGFYDLDALTQGYQPHQLIIVAGRPAMGKSAFAAAQLKHISRNMPCALFSLEMSGGQIAQRMMAEDSRIESGRMVSGRIDDAEWGGLSQSVANLSGLNLWIDESMQITPSHILSQCRKLKAENGELGLVAVDYLHLMLDGDNDETKALGRLTRQFKKMARALNCPVMLLSQLSRAVESRTNKRPQMSDLRQSGSIEQDADLIAFLYRDEYYNPDTQDKGVAEVILAKHRGGPTGTAKVLFEGEFTAFKNLARNS